MTRSLYVLLALFLGSLHSLATMQCGSDQTALVQKNPKVQVPQAALEQEATGYCVDTSFDSGNCGDGECQECNPQGEVLIPTNPAGFPSPGSLTCGEDACEMSSGAPATSFYQFRNASNYLVCKESDACKHFHAKNLAAACCDGGCSGASLHMHGDHASGGDLCCSGACRGATVTGVRTLGCLNGGCAELKAGLSGDVVFSGFSAGGGQQLTFTGSERHCVQLLGSSVGRLFQAKLTFLEPTSVSMKCTGGFALDCRQVDVFLSKGACFHIDCGSSLRTCEGFKVLPLEVGETGFQCFCTGTNCGWTSQYSYCQNTTDTSPCGAGICPATLPVCMRDTTTVDCGRLATTTTTTLARSVAADAGGEVQGDPHLRTLDGRHYTLLKQGNFLLWGFSGETDLATSGEKMPAFSGPDFEILAHYAGHASFTKGMLFLDKSTMPNQALEVTTEECAWQHWDAGDLSWRPIQSAQMEIGAFNLSVAIIGKQRKVEILLKHENMRKLAQLWVSCRPGKQLSAKVRMASPKDLRFVRGELAPGRISLAEGGSSDKVSQTADDPEYSLASNWADLGGSASAASYFKLMDSTGDSAAFTSCNAAVKEKFAKTCQKHLGTAAGDWHEQHEQALEDCIFDLCQGAGETSAELAAEIFNS